MKEFTAKGAKDAKQCLMGWATIPPARIVFSFALFAPFAV